MFTSEIKLQIYREIQTELLLGSTLENALHTLIRKAERQIEIEEQEEIDDDLSGQEIDMWG